MLKWMRLLLMVAVLMLGLGSALAQDSGNTLIMARAADTTGLDPHTQTAFASLRLLELVYEPLVTLDANEPLVTLDANLNIVPALAESWTFADDAMTLTMNLRQGVKFHDGSDFTAADVVASFNRILNEETGAAARANYGAAARANYLSIASMDTPDDYTVVFNLSVADVPLLAAMASVNASIVPSEVIESGDFAASAIGTGPFILDEWIPEEVTRLSANAEWWGEGPFVDGIEMRVIPDEASILAALRAGEIDFALLNDPLVATLLNGDSSITLNAVPALAYHVFQLNPSRAPMDNLAVRQAMSCAIDRQEVLDTASLGEGTVTGPLTIPAYQVDTSGFFCYQKDLDRARELMAGVEPFTIKAIVANAEPPTALSEAQSIQAQLAEIGITLEIEPLELSVYVDRWLAGDFDSAIALNGGRPDPYTMYARPVHHVRPLLDERW